MVVTTRGGTPIYVRDVASVAIGPMPREGAVSRDGRGETLSGMIVMLKGANGREVVAAVEARLEEIRPLLAARRDRIRPFYNQGEVVDRTTRTVFKNLLEGALLVTLILCSVPAQPPRVADHGVGHSAVVAVRVPRDGTRSVCPPT